MDFGENLKKLREQRGLSQAELAKMAKFSQAAIWNFEHGRIIPRERSIDALAQALNVTTDRLILGKEEEQ